ncbi:MAG: sugar phosphate nucleotidyltransferase, partial [Terriglobales bacterium]
FGCNLRYAYQRGEGGIADALRLARDFAAGEPIAVLLGDNLFEHGVAAAAEEFRQQRAGARVLLKEVLNPERFGVATLEGKRVVKIEEKPRLPQSHYAVTGCYFYDAGVFDKIARCRPSARKELEITDVNNLYLAEGTLEWSLVEGWWGDAGTFDSLRRMTNLIAERKPSPARAGA